MDDQSPPVVMSKPSRFGDVSVFLDWLDKMSLDDKSSESDLPAPTWGQSATNKTKEKSSVEPLSDRETTGHRIVKSLTEQDVEQESPTKNGWNDPYDESLLIDLFPLEKTHEYDSYGWGNKLCLNCLYLVIQSQFQVDDPFSSRVFNTREFYQCVTCPLVKSLTPWHNDEGSQIQPRFGDPQPQYGFWYSQINVLESNRSLGLIGICRKFPDPEYALPISHGLFGSPQRWLRHWLIECDTTRKECKHLKDPAVNIYLIDVLQHCLVSASSKCRYLALSYVWGGVEQLKTKKSNISDFSKIGGLQKYSKQYRDLSKILLSLSVP